ncbi:MAG TPA: permease [Lachnospiraceae bacterium]|nr:permease [Lachnospiraceae bacterium]
MLNVLKETIIYVLQTLKNDAAPLLFGIIVAAIINVYIDSDKLKSLLLERKKVSILGSVAFGAFTPLCACGTMAIIVSMLTTVLPWGPIIAFITSSPLMSPDLFVMLSGIISFKFAVVLTVSSILIGCVAGYLSYYLEKHTKFFHNQIRLQAGSNQCSGCQCACTQESKSIMERFKTKELLSVIVNVGLKKILLYFSIFAAIGYLINRFVPSEIIMSLFGSNNFFSVPIAALIGVPLYVSDGGAISLIKMLLDSGASGGAILAFMITGPGTSIGAIVGSLTIMKRKAVLFYVGILFVSAIVLGYIYNFLLVFI